MGADSGGLPSGGFSGEVAAITVDARGTVSAAGGPALTALGVEPDSLIGRSVSSAFGDRTSVLQGFQRALQGQADRLVLESGGRSLELRFEPRREGGAVAIILDVSPLRTCAEEGRASERDLERVFRQSPGGVWTTDQALRITHFQGRVPWLRDLDSRRVVGLRIQDVVRTEDPAEPALARHLAALAGQPQSFRYQFHDRWFEILLEPLSDGEGHSLGCIGAAVDVTERARVEEELASSRHRLEEAQRVAHVGSFEWDVASNRVLWSDELHRIYGLEPGQFGGTFEAFLSHVDPEDLDRTKGVIFDAFRDVKPFIYEHRVLRPDGSARILHTRGDVIAEKGRVERVAGCCWDVTELRESIEKQEHTLSLLEATINATADGLLVVDSAGRVTAYNKRLLDLWRLTPRDVEHLDFQQLLSLVHGQLANGEECSQRVRELATQPAAESFDSLRFLDGRFFERFSRPQFIGGEIVGRVWSYRDVTERERLYRRAVFLADAAKLLASLDVEPAIDGVAHLAVPFLGDGCAVDLLVNGGPRRLIAVSRDASRPINPEVHATTLAGHSSIHTVGALSYMAVPLVVKGDVIGSMTFVAPPARSYTMRDLELTETLARRVALAVENARLYRGAQEALKARDEFLSIAAHEIRGPITSMQLVVQGLRRGRLPAAAQEEALAIVERESARLSRFVDELLDVSRVRAGQLRFDFQEVDLGEVVHDVAARCGEVLARSGSSLSVTAGQVVGQWDRFRLEEVVTNLLMNAIQFGLGKPIEVAVQAEGGWATLVVKDRGIGIPGEAQERIFQPFERAVSVRHYGGLGLGLYIVRTVVEGLGGRVTVQSVAGAATTFTVTLPQTRHP